MEASRFERLTKAAASGVGRRQLVRGVLAGLGSGVLVHGTGDESTARQSRCCRREKRRAKQSCRDAFDDECKHLADFTCEKTGPGTCWADFVCGNGTTRSCFID